jgi:rSAM/selenodomain-associated transferase 2
MGEAPLISVIIPALNEAEGIEACLASARQTGYPIEIIVVDGGSTDGTEELARGAGASVLTCVPGRAGQQNAGARMAVGEILLFLHADTRLPEGWAETVLEVLSRPGVAGGAFRFAIDAPGAGYRFIEAMANIRSRACQIPFGDQALFLKRERFVELGGFPEMPIMEDFAFVERLRRTGRVLTLRESALTSPRRWQRLGKFRVTVLNKVMIWGYKAGVSPDRLARWYKVRTG